MDDESQHSYHPRSVWIGFDPREVDAFAVTRASIRKAVAPYPINALHLGYLQQSGLYQRPTTRRDGVLRDDISDAPMATEFAISRFLVPHLAGSVGWAVFMDCDMMVRAPIADLFACADKRYAVMVVKHRHDPGHHIKMDGQIQTSYERKNWSSVMLFNLAHPTCRALTPHVVNTMRGLDLHQFKWVPDDAEIGDLPHEWNWLAGHSNPAIDPKNVHYTEGVPSMRGYGDAPYADEWRELLREWAMYE